MCGLRATCSGAPQFPSQSKIARQNSFPTHHLKSYSYILIFRIQCWGIRQEQIVQAESPVLQIRRKPGIDVTTLFSHRQALQARRSFLTIRASDFLQKLRRIAAPRNAQVIRFEMDSQFVSPLESREISRAKCLKQYGIFKYSISQEGLSRDKTQQSYSRDLGTNGLLRITTHDYDYASQPSLHR